MFSDAPLLSVSGAVELKTFATLAVTAPVFAITTPPVATNGVIHSCAVAALGVALLYCNVALGP